MSSSVRIGIEATTARAQASTRQLYVPRVYDWGESLPLFRTFFQVAKEKGIDLCVFDRADIFDEELSRGQRTPEGVVHPCMRSTLFPSGQKIVLGNYMLENGLWKRKLAPLPDVIYNAEIPATPNEDPTYNGCKVLVPHTFPSLANDKLMSNFLAQDTLPSGSPISVPEFCLYSRQGVENILDKHGRVFLKPRYGRMGRGAIGIVAQLDGYHVQYDQNGNSKHTSTTYSSLETALQQVEKTMNSSLQDSSLTGGNAGTLFDLYLIQQFIATHPYQHEGTSRVCDIRTFTQRGTNGEFTSFIAVGRIGSAGNITAGISTSGFAVPAEHLLDAVYDGDRSRVIATLEEIKDGSFKIHRRFEQQTGPIAEAATDYLIGKNGSVYYCETNARPGKIDVIDIFGPNARDCFKYYYHGKDTDQLRVSCEQLIEYAIHLHTSRGKL